MRMKLTLSRRTTKDDVTGKPSSYLLCLQGIGPTDDRRWQMSSAPDRLFLKFILTLKFVFYAETIQLVIPSVL